MGDFTMATAGRAFGPTRAAPGISLFDRFVYIGHANFYKTPLPTWKYHRMYYNNTNFSSDNCENFTRTYCAILDYIECMRCRLLLPMIARSVCLSVTRLNSAARAMCAMHSLQPLPNYFKLLLSNRCGISPLFGNRSVDFQSL